MGDLGEGDCRQKELSREKKTREKKHAGRIPYRLGIRKSHRAFRPEGVNLRGDGEGTFAGGWQKDPAGRDRESRQWYVVWQKKKKEISR